MNEGRGGNEAVQPTAGRGCESPHRYCLLYLLLYARSSTVEEVPLTNLEVCPHISTIQVVISKHFLEKNNIPTNL